MNCGSCGAPGVIVEGLGEGRTRRTCQKCGHTEIKDQQGRQMLTDDGGHPPGGGRQLLTEG